MVKNLLLALIFGIFVFLDFCYVESAVYTPLSEEEKKLVMNSPTRVMFSIAGKWEYSEDGQNWEDVTLPSIFYNKGKIFLRKIIKIDRNLLGNYVWHLYFLGVSDEIEIYWNEQYLGRYVSEGLPLWITLSHKIVVTERNTLRLVVNSSQSLARLIKQEYLFYPKITTGIPWDFFLVRTENVWINNFVKSIKLESPSFAAVQAKINISSLSIDRLFPNQTTEVFETVNLVCEVYIRDKQTYSVISNTARANFNISSFRNIVQTVGLSVTNPQLWSTDSPYLYEIVVRLKLGERTIDEMVYNFGFLRWDKYQYKEQFHWLLNNKLFTFKGVEWVLDIDYYNSGNSFKKFENDIVLLKSLGANAVLFKFFPPPPFLLNLCSKYGLFVFVDIPFYYVPSTIIGKYDLVVQYQNFATNMAKFYSTEPCFFGIGLGEGLNEEKEEVSRYYKTTNKKIKANFELMTYKKIPLDKPIQDISDFDFVIITDYFNNYTPEEAFNKLQIKSIGVTVPILYSFGTVVDPNNRHGYNDPLSIIRVAYYQLLRLNFAAKMNLAGTIVTSYTDYFTENPLPFTSFVNPYRLHFGLIELNRQPRLSYFVVKSVYTSEEPPVINPGFKQVQIPVSYLITGIFSFFILGSMFYRSRRFREYFFRSSFRTYNFFADVRDHRIISIPQTTMLGIIIAVINGLYLSSSLYFYKLDPNFQKLLNLLVPPVIIREYINTLSWMPEISILVFSVLVFLKFVLISLILKVFSLFVRNRIFFSDTFKLTVWSFTHFVVFLPVSIFAINVYYISTAISYAFAIMYVLIVFWCVWRLIKGTWVVFDVPPIKVLVWVSGILMFFVILLAIYYQSTNRLFDFIVNYI